MVSLLRRVAVVHPAPVDAAEPEVAVEDPARNQRADVLVLELLDRGYGEPVLRFLHATTVDHGPVVRVHDGTGRDDVELAVVVVDVVGYHVRLALATDDFRRVALLV